MTLPRPRPLIFVFACLPLLATLARAQGAAGSTATASDASGAPNAEQLSYLLGVQYGDTVRTFGVGDAVTIEALSRGLKDGLKGKSLSAAERTQMQAYLHNAMLAMIERNQQAAKDFLAKNAKQPGVVTTPSGLEYRILKPGNRKAPAVTVTDEVTVQYRGKLIDGTEFDSSFSRSEPARFRVNGVIRGWQEALLLMKPGAEWQLFVPPELAYGFEQRQGIPAASLLIFDVQLISVTPDGSAPAPAPAAPPSSK